MTAALDATGDASLTALAAGAVTPRTQQRQTATLAVRYGNIPVDADLSAATVGDAVRAATAAAYRSAAIPPAESGGLTVAAAGTGLLGTLGSSLATGEFLNAANDHFPAAVLGWSAAQILGVGDLRLPVQVDISGTYFTVVGMFLIFPLTISCLIFSTFATALATSSAVS